METRGNDQPYSSFQSSIRQPTNTALCVCLQCAEMLNKKTFFKAVVNSVLHFDVFDQFSSYI